MKTLKLTRARYMTGAALLTLSAVAAPSHAHHVSIGGPAGSSGPVIGAAPATLGQGKFSVGISSQYIQYEDFSRRELEGFAAVGIEEVHSTNYAVVTTIGLEYGVTDRFSVRLVAPYIQRTDIREGELEDGAPEAHRLGDVEGFGDLTLIGKYLLIQQSDLQLSVMAGAQLPTGHTHERADDGSRFEQEFQPGSGATRAILGLAMAKTYGTFTWHSSLTYTFADRGSQDTKLGEVLTYDVGVSYRLGQGPHVHDDGTFERHAALDLILEINGEWQENEEVGSAVDPNSGGNLLFVSPGVRYLSAQGWNAALSVGIPVSDNLKGRQNDPEPRLFLSVGFDF